MTAWKVKHSLVEAEERLYKTADGRLVAEGDPDAVWLFCVPGDLVPYDVAVGFGLAADETTAR